LVQGAGTGTQGETEIIFKTSHTATTRNTEKMKIGNLGDVTIASGNLVIGTSGKGIDFSATSDGSGTTTSELLDDYEEGTWTPVAISGWTSATVVTSKYTKIGRTVLINLYMTSLQGKDASIVIIGGLPFTVSANVYCTGPVETAEGPLGIIRANANGTQAACYYANASDAERENLTGNDVGVHLLFSVVYETSA